MSSPKRKEVLLLEADLQLRSALSEILELSKFKVLPASNLVEATRSMILSSAPIFGLILNFPMLHKNGAEIFECATNGRWRFEVILAMTSGGEKRVLSQDFKGENIKLLKMPFDAKDFLKLLK
jgi:DNA-binding NtrC family response regulator